MEPMGGELHGKKELVKRGDTEPERVSTLQNARF